MRVLEVYWYRFPISITKIIISIIPRLVFLLVVLDHLLRIPRLEHILVNIDYLTIYRLHLPSPHLTVLLTAKLQQSAYQFFFWCCKVSLAHITLFSDLKHLSVDLFDGFFNREQIKTIRWPSRMLLKLSMIFFLFNFRCLAAALWSRFLFSSSLVLVRCWSAKRQFFFILWVIIFFFGCFIVVAEGDVIFGFPGVEFIIISSPLDEAVLFVYIVSMLLLTHRICTTFSTS